MWHVAAVEDFYAFRKDNNYNNKKKVRAFLYGIVRNSCTFHETMQNMKPNICIFQYLPVLEIAEFSALFIEYFRYELLYEQK